MKSRIFACLAVLAALALSWQTISADGILKRHHHGAPPACEPGYQMIEEVVMQDVVKHVCRMVPETKKKWVYTQIDEPFCIQTCKHPHKCDCAEGCKVMCRPRLVKIQVDEPCPTMKCVTETIVEKVPCVVYKKVPIGTAPAAPSRFMPPASNGGAAVEVIPVKPIPVGKKKQAK